MSIVLAYGYYCETGQSNTFFREFKEWLDKLIANGQVATVYSDNDGNVSMDEEYNINGSYMSIEGITSPDGRVLGKMGHSERKGSFIGKNVDGDKDQKIFENGVAYFK